MSPQHAAATRMRSWQTALDELRTAVQALLRGDGAHYKSLWSHGEDVTMMGAYGGLASGWGQVSETIDLSAARYRDWSPRYREEIVTAQATADVAYLVLRETVQNGDDDSSARARRITLLFRRDDGRWRIFHHHSDPLHDPVSGRRNER
ncbi:nuclear transport factor 2 family protein [Micromonospora sp. HUAS LYJ1]|uniref:nuclear transport factor 2 family protein n=1 Tax=Micromonospora sp. HUAS LYJ1 TaxID=3061626 RepID=UPI00267415AD|nr:nuclear transport factor 2 family protein [Micromonospora sp. HUAS LYJ1]WKU07121.1 nuclear transport factor 2 family protein [Micromonospora sp. HUAS LYJ1]